MPVQDSKNEDATVPLAAILCLSIAGYALFITVGLLLRQLLVRKGICLDVSFPCCNCTGLGLQCAHACNCFDENCLKCDIWNACCPSKETCSSCFHPECSSCTFYKCTSLQEWCQHMPSACGESSICGCTSQTCQSLFCPPCAFVSLSNVCQKCNCNSWNCSDCGQCTFPECNITWNCPDCSYVNCFCCEISIKERASS